MRGEMSQNFLRVKIGFSGKTFNFCRRGGWSSEEAFLFSPRGRRYFSAKGGRFQGLSTGQVKPRAVGCAGSGQVGMTWLDPWKYKTFQARPDPTRPDHPTRGEITLPSGYLLRTCPSRGSGQVKVAKRQW